MDYYLSKLKELGSSFSVLYVEDDSAISSEMMTMLEKFFDRVVLASNGEDGLEKYKNDSFDIVMTDISMPKMDGLEMSKEIKRLHREQIIIIITAFVNELYFNTAIDIGVSSFIPKPASANQIIHSLYEAAIRVEETKQNALYRTSLEELVEKRTKELIKTYITDDLTGLANFHKLKEDLSGDKTYCAILLNIDNFDTVNNSFGVSYGDALLKSVASSLQHIIPVDARLYRGNGDEFVVLLENISVESAHNVAIAIRAYFVENKIEIFDNKISVTFTIGIATGNNIEIVRNAKLAIREVRLVGRNRIQIYTPDSQYLQIQNSRIFWTDRSREAIDNNNFVPFFQPILDNATGKIIKYECLARMYLDGQTITPDKFIEPARLSGLLPGITRIMIDRSFAIFAGKDEKLSVNIGDYDIKDGYLRAYLEQKVQKYNIDPSNVTLEILETISVQDAKESIRQLKELKNMGFLLAIDDFGTESSNFSRLLDLDVDYIKIDGSFIKNLDSDSNSNKITESIVSFAHSIGAKVIAEYVHCESVFDAVKKHGIEYSQGYFIGQPNSTTEVKK